ncbi:MAG: cobyric acid synthase [Desulfobulbaceae bacterium]|nr:cobyric acid synthase [Desulfobulbaceae bacterium]
MVQQGGHRKEDLGHGGNLAVLATRAGCGPESILDFSANLNPLGPPELLRRVVSRHVEGLAHYPDPTGEKLLTRLADSLGLAPGQLVLGNGSTELLYAIPRAFACRRAVIPVPAYLDYARAARLAGLEVLTLPLAEAEDFRLDFAQLGMTLLPGDLVFLGRPNNPTGLDFSAADLLALVVAQPETFFVVDESFFEFVAPASELIRREMVANLLVVRSLTKFYAIPGLRLGFAAAAPATMARLRGQIVPWTVNSLALAVGEEVLAEWEYGERSRAFVRERRGELAAGLVKIPGLKIYPGAANYLLLRLEKPGLTAASLAERLLTGQPGLPIAIRVCANYPGLDSRYFRVAVRTCAENLELCAALARELAPDLAPAFHRLRKTPALMLQGTASNAGKSVLTAALGRIMLQDGYRVAPFKAQNMSLNSFVTRDGGEMGRAQVVQAQACRLDPEVRMNPVLLKPSSEVGCQVIVNGRVAGNMSVEEYIRYKPEAARAAHAAYDSLAAEYQVMLLEGAGSPAEVNLKSHDIVNMAMARHAEAKVLLVGDIDRGGVFASFVGSLEVMAEWERDLVAGFLVNRFRGLAELLADAYNYVQSHTGKEVFGTVPFLPDLGLPEEDSVGFKGGLYQKPRPSGDYVTIGVIDLPHISNFTDVEPFLAEPDVYLRVIRSQDELAAVGPELAALVLPGSKNVMHDLDYLRQSGLAEQIKRLAMAGEVEIVGICGGFQMLGREINDPHQLESAGGRLAGLAILEMTTTLAAEKTLIQQSGLHLPSHLAVHGYEIHHGQTVAAHAKALRLADGSEDGAVSADGRVWGSYLHGIFDDDDFRRWFIDMLRSSRQLMPIGSVVAPYDLEPAFERLAAVVRASIDLPRIYRLLGLR